MTVNQWKVAGLLFCSGMCALIYQTVWLRQFRLIFGASTFATAAVLAIFMGGLGLGSALLGKRADRKERPLGWYATLEIGIALSAAISPLLLFIAAKIYFALGGSVSMGIFGATVVRLVLATLVLAVPTVLMGGTLPAAARAVETNDDSGRRGVALLYGINTLGAVAGALISTFFLLEVFGNRQTLLVAVLVNLLVAMIARRMSGTLPVNEIAAQEEESIEPATPRRFVYLSAAVAGFAFLLMELVWYRMLSPLLGGTTFMFGLILAVALLGIGLGGTAYALLRRGPATIGGFAMTCALEALAIAIPFALGDWLAVLANVMRPIGLTGFAGTVAGWTLITSIVVLPAAFISGVQFPLLISLLGRGREQVGREIGAAYAWNTAGAIAGSLAGGFGLMPLLTAPGCWKLVTFVLCALGVAALMQAANRKQTGFAIASVAAVLLAVLCTSAEGPTAVWRHSGIGAGRAPSSDTINDMRSWMQETRYTIAWEAEGRESSIGVVNGADWAFMVNGKSDGSARGDAATQVMGGLIGAILHPGVKTSLVVGLGTGSTSGWLAVVPTMQRVDVVELEPAVLDVARQCAPVNMNAMRNPRMHTMIGDAREVLLASPTRYDLIFSEPSNPYRAGVSSLFTKEFYEASSRRLNDDGLFLQWVQMYSIDAATMRTIYATLTSVFPHVVTFRTLNEDAVLVASRKPIVFDMDHIRRRLAQEPFHSAMLHSWRTTSAEGFVAHAIANENLARMAAEDATELNTDDRQVIEFGFARSLNQRLASLSPIVRISTGLGTLRPLHLRGAIDWNAVERAREDNTELLAAEATKLADAANPEAERAIAVLRPLHPIEADVIQARLRLRQGRLEEAVDLLRRGFIAFRTNPWPVPEVMRQAHLTAGMISEKDPKLAPKLHEVLSKPFVLRLQEWNRRPMRAYLAHAAYGCGAPTIQALLEMEPTPPWVDRILGMRVQCYSTRPELADLTVQAWSDLEKFVNAEPKAVVTRRDRRESGGSSSSPR